MKKKIIIIEAKERSHPCVSILKAKGEWVFLAARASTVPQINIMGAWVSSYPPRMSTNINFSQ